MKKDVKSKSATSRQSAKRIARARIAHAAQPVKEASDEIEFTKISSNEKLLAKVINLYIYETSEQLYADLPLDKCGYAKEELHYAKASDMEKIYSKEAQNKMGRSGHRNKSDLMRCQRQSFYKSEEN